MALLLSITSILGILGCYFGILAVLSGDTEHGWFCLSISVVCLIILWVTV